MANFAIVWLSAILNKFNIARPNMPRTHVIGKKVGETPLVAIERYREEAGLSEDVPMAYAGRLDPMADGKLLVLIGEECKRQKEYHSLDKEYTFRVLVGYRSDTYDILGIARRTGNDEPTRLNLVELVKRHTGTITLPYPAFSARTVRGKPLHERTLEGSVDPHEIPTKTSRVYSLEVVATEHWSRDQVTNEIFTRINSFPEVTDPRKALGADFRRAEVRARWTELLNSPDAPEQFEIITLHCICSSGTYMRSLADEFGGLALSITRTKMGKYILLPFGLDFWLYSY